MRDGPLYITGSPPPNRVRSNFPPAKLAFDIPRVQTFTPAFNPPPSFGTRTRTPQFAIYSRVIAEGDTGQLSLTSRHSFTCLYLSAWIASASKMNSSPTLVVGPAQRQMLSPLKPKQMKKYRNGLDSGSAKNCTLPPEPLYASVPRFPTTSFSRAVTRPNRPSPINSPQTRPFSSHCISTIPCILLKFRHAHGFHFSCP